MQAKDNKMEHIGKIVAYLILAINAFFVGTLILSAYSPYLNPLDWGLHFHYFW